MITYELTKPTKYYQIKYSSTDNSITSVTYGDNKINVKTGDYLPENSTITFNLSSANVMLHDIKNGKTLKPSGVTTSYALKNLISDIEVIGSTQYSITVRYTVSGSQSDDIITLYNEKIKDENGKITYNENNKINNGQSLTASNNDFTIYVKYTGDNLIKITTNVGNLSYDSTNKLYTIKNISKNININVKIIPLTCVINYTRYYGDGNVVEVTNGGRIVTPGSTANRNSSLIVTAKPASNFEAKTDSWNLIKKENEGQQVLYVSPIDNASLVKTINNVCNLSGITANSITIPEIEFKSLKTQPVIHYNFYNSGTPCCVAKDTTRWTANTNNNYMYNSGSYKKNGSKGQVNERRDIVCDWKASKGNNVVIQFFVEGASYDQYYTIQYRVGKDVEKNKKNTWKTGNFTNLGCSKGKRFSFTCAKSNKAFYLKTSKGAEKRKGKKYEHFVVEFKFIDNLYYSKSPNRDSWYDTYMAHVYVKK